MDSHLYRGPATIIGNRGQVYWLLHQNKVLACCLTRSLPVEKSSHGSDPSNDEGVSEFNTNELIDATHNAIAPASTQGKDNFVPVPTQGENDFVPVPTQGEDVNVHVPIDLEFQNPENYPKKGDKTSWG